MAGSDHFLTLSCPDKAGIVHAVTGLLAEENLTILDLQQFSDPASKMFFMRVHFGHATELATLQTSMADLAKEMSMTYDIRSVDTKPKVLIMVSKIGHCLNDLLFRVKSGQLKIEIPVIVSNHPEFAEFDRKLKKLIKSKRTSLMQEFSFWPTTSPRKLGGVFELRTYTLHPGNLLEWEHHWRKGLEARKEVMEGVGACELPFFDH